MRSVSVAFFRNKRARFTEDYFRYHCYFRKVRLHRALLVRGLQSLLAGINPHPPLSLGKREATAYAPHFMYCPAVTRLNTVLRVTNLTFGSVAHDSLLNDNREALTLSHVGFTLFPTPRPPLMAPSPITAARPVAHRAAPRNSSAFRPQAMVLLPTTAAQSAAQTAAARFSTTPRPQVARFSARLVTCPTAQSSAAVAITSKRATPAAPATT
jgi:hypothetical protein